jgi:hypothetical protein
MDVDHEKIEAVDGYFIRDITRWITGSITVSSASPVPIDTGKPDMVTLSILYLQIGYHYMHHIVNIVMTYEPSTRKQPPEL